MAKRTTAPMSPASRRDAIDVARVLALLIVVAGHLTLAVIDRDADGAVRGANLLELRPQWSWLAAMAPMPIFFAAAGWANATATIDTAGRRLTRLVGVGAAVVCTWSALVLLTSVVGGGDVITDGARLATQPLWFLAAYVPFAAIGARLSGLAARQPALCLVVALGTMGLLDAARFAAGASEWVGWPGFFVAWVTPWLAGAWWRSRWDAGGFAERRVGAALAVAAIGVGALLVARAGYSPALIDAVPGRRSNTTPPTLYTAVAALAQVGVLMLLAGALDRIGVRWRRLWDRAGEAAVGIYAWHLTALALCAGIVALGAPAPERLTPTWWTTRPLWWAIVLAVTGLFVAATAFTGSRVRRIGSRSSPAAATVAGIVATVAGAALVGLVGPRSVFFAVVCSALFLGGWWLLRGRVGQPAVTNAK